MVPSFQELVVEVLNHRRDGWWVGSGLFVGANLILTAAHNVGEGELLVGLGGRVEHPATIEVSASMNDVDLALVRLEVGVAGAMPRRRYGLIDRDTRRRSSSDVARLDFRGSRSEHRDRAAAPLQRPAPDGEIPTGENLGRELLTMRVTSAPRTNPGSGSAWEGMSGAVVVADGVVIGVVSEAHPPRGDGLSNRCPPERGGGPTECRAVVETARHRPLSACAAAGAHPTAAAGLPGNSRGARSKDPRRTTR